MQNAALGKETYRELFLMLRVEHENARSFYFHLQTIFFVRFVADYRFSSVLSQNGLVQVLFHLQLMSLLNVFTPDTTVQVFTLLYDNHLNQFLHYK